MELVETTISEHIFNQGKAEGIIEGQIAVLESLYRQGILSEEQMKYMAASLREKLTELTGRNA